MNKFLTTILLTILSLSVSAQDKVTDELKALSDKNEFKKIIKQYSSKTDDYSARSLYYVGMAYYMSEDDANCIKFMDLSIQKDAQDPAPYYIKASTLNYMEKYDEAIKNFEMAIGLKSDDAVFYSGLADAYYQLEKYESALKNYQKATELADCPDRPYSMIAQIYADMNEKEKSLQAFYVAKSKISKESGSYLNALYNIGLFEYLKGNADKAEPALLEMIKLSPNDFQPYAKLIQVYYLQKEYEKAKPYKEQLYAAHKKGLLEENLKDMFCFDQFDWNGYHIQVHERYQNESKGDIYNKHLFYVIDKDENVVLRIQTEFSPFSVELGGAKYLLCVTKGSSRFNPGIGFDDDFEYENLKAAAIQLMEKHVK